MKRLTMLICLVLALVSLSAHAADAETTPPLWPAYDPDTACGGILMSRDRGGSRRGISMPLNL